MQQGFNVGRACQILTVMALAFSLQAVSAAVQNKGQGQAPQGSSSKGA